MKDDQITCTIDVVHIIMNTFAHCWKKIRELIKLQTETDQECTTYWGQCFIEY